MLFLERRIPSFHAEIGGHAQSTVQAKHKDPERLKVISELARDCLAAWLVHATGPASGQMFQQEDLADPASRQSVMQRGTSVFCKKRGCSHAGLARPLFRKISRGGRRGDSLWVVRTRPGLETITARPASLPDWGQILTVILVP